MKTGSRWNVAGNYQTGHGEIVAPDDSIVMDARGHIVLAFDHKRIAEGTSQEDREAYAADFVEAVADYLNSVTWQPFKGLRVEAIEDIERYPHFYIAKGATGVVADMWDDGEVWVLMDEYVEGCEEWRNKVQCATAFDFFCEFAPIGCTD